MAFPVWISAGGTTGSTAASSCVCNMPTGVQGGDLLIALFRSASGTTATFPGDWSTLVSNNTADASDDVTTIAYKFSAGSESATFTVTTSGTQKFACNVICIGGAENPTVQAPEITSATTGTSVNPDGGNITPTGGAKDYLFISAITYEGEQTLTSSVEPTGYDHFKNGSNSGTAGAVATNCRVQWAGKRANATSDNPGQWTIDTSDDWTAWTIAVHPRPDPVATFSPYPQLLPH